MVERISQSMIKDLRSYNAGEECGNIIRYKYVEDKLLNLQSKEMAVGSYFEFMLTGALPKNNELPKPKYGKSGKEMDMDYKRATENAKRVRDVLLNGMGLIIISYGKTITKGRHKGTIDLIVETTREIKFTNGTVWAVGYRFVIDIKYSGLLYNQWEKHGWLFTREIQKEYHGTQAKEYHFITGMDFYFLVVSSTNLEVEDEITGKKEFAPTDMRLLHVPIDERMVEMHLAEANRLYEKFVFDVELGLVTRASLKVCSKCPLKDECDDKVLFPQVETVDINLS